MLKTRKSIVKKLDSVFSQYIRLRKSKNAISECYTCGKKDHWKNLQCGHFMSRKHYSTRWEELNCQVQCYGCNISRYGEQFKFGLRLNKEYGKDTAEILERQCRTIMKFSNSDLLEKIEHYKSLAKQFGGY